MYIDASKFLDKGEEVLRWGDMYHMFKKKKNSIDVEDQYELKVFKNIRRSGIFRVATHVFVFLCIDVITWVLKHVDLENRYVNNAMGQPIASFHPADLNKCYHLERGTKKLDSELLGVFKHIAMDLCPT
jgi:hypothetical protein